MKTCPKCLTQFQPEEGKRGRPHTYCVTCRPAPRQRPSATVTTPPPAPPVAQAEAETVPQQQEG